MFHLNGFRLRSTCPVQMGRRCFEPFRPDGAIVVVVGVFKAELKAVLCQPVFYGGLITHTPMEKLLEGN